jgi:Tol biopolymer transport system component
MKTFRPSHLALVCLLGFSTVTASFASLLPGAVVRVSESAEGHRGNKQSTSGTISGDGRYVAFESFATNLGPTDTNGTHDCYLKDLLTGEVKMIGTTFLGAQPYSGSGTPVISGNGRYVLFYNYGLDMWPGITDVVRRLYRKDLLTGELRLVSCTAGSVPGNGGNVEYACSADCRYVAFISQSTNLSPADTDSTTDVYVKDMVTGALLLVGTGTNGTKQNGLCRGLDMSGDGRYVVFSSYATNLTTNVVANTANIYLKDLRSGSLEVVSCSSNGTAGNYTSFEPSISGDGRYVAFWSGAGNLAGATFPRTGLYVKDRKTGLMKSVGLSVYGAAEGDPYLNPHISQDGRYVAFSSYSDHIVPGDDNKLPDYFVEDLMSGEVRLASPSIGEATGKNDNQTYMPLISADGGVVTYYTPRSDLVMPDLTGTYDQFAFRTGFSADERTLLSVPNKIALMGKRVMLVAKIKDPATGFPIPGVPVKFFVELSYIGDMATTDEAGMARLSYVVPEELSIGQHRFGAVFEGTSSYSTSSNTAYLTVDNGPSRLIPHDSFALRGTNVGLFAKLTNSAKIELPGRSLSFSVDGVAAGNATTGNEGVAKVVFSVPVNMAVGDHTVTVQFAGDTGHAATTSTSHLTIA